MFFDFGSVKLAKRDPEFAEHILSDKVVYDRDINELRYNKFKQEVDVLKLTPAEPA